MKKKKPEHVNHERWLISYADFITLLFAFFVVLYASAQVDKRKAGRMAMAIQVAFQELGVFETSNTKLPLQDEDAMPFQQVQTVENVNRTADLSTLVNPMKAKSLNASAGGSKIPGQDAEAAIQKALDPEIQKNEVTMTMRRDGAGRQLEGDGNFSTVVPPPFALRLPRRHRPFS